MKILVGVLDHAPGGIHRAVPGEILVLRPGEIHYGKWLALCRRDDCYCSRTWTGSLSNQPASLARVAEPPLCFNLKPELAQDLFIIESLRLADNYPVGTLLRAQFNWTRGTQRLSIEDERAFLDAWDVTVVGGPN